MKKLITITVIAVLGLMFSLSALPDTDTTTGFKKINYSNNALVLKVLMNSELPKQANRYTFTKTDISTALSFYEQKERNNFFMKQPIN